MSIPIKKSSFDMYLEGVVKFCVRPSLFLWGGLGLFALWLRLCGLGYMEMWHDQSRTLNMALQWVHGGPFPIVGELSSLGIHNAPLVEYLYALPLFLSNENIISVCSFVAIVNLIGIAVAGWATARVFGSRVAWWATLLFVVNPWAVHYGRLIWMQSFVPAFAAVLYACVLLYFTTEAKARYLVLGMLSLSATIQTHLISVVLLPVLLIIAVLNLRRIKVGPFLIATGLFILSLIPFLIFHFTTRFSDWEALRTGIGGRLDINLTSLVLALDLFRAKGVFSVPFVTDSSWWLTALERFEPDRLAVVLLGSSIVYAIGYSILGWKKDRSQAVGVLLLWLWFCLPIVAFVPHTRLLFSYYFLYLFPAGVVLLAWGVEHLCQFIADLSKCWNHTGGRYVRQILIVAIFLPLALVAVYQVSFVVNGQNVMAQGRIGRQRLLDVQYTIDVAKRLLDERPGCQLVVMTDRPLWEDDRFGLLSEFVGRERVRIVEAGSAYLYPSPCAVYFLPAVNTEAKAWLDAIAQPLPGHTIHTPGETWLFYDLPALKREQSVADLETGRVLGAWENGLQLRDFSLQGEVGLGNNKAIMLYFTWVVSEQLPPDLRERANSLRFGNYLLLNDNVLISQMDGVGLDSREWRIGDIFLTRWQIPVPVTLAPGDYSLATAVYALPEVKRVQLTDGADLLFLERFSLIE